MTHDSSQQSLDEARGALGRIIFGAMAAHTVGAATRLGVLDLIGDGERTADELAAAAGTQPQATVRLLRALTGLGILTERAPGSFAATPVGALMRKDVPGSLFSFIRMFTDPAMLRAWEQLDESVRTGETAFDKVFGTDFFSHLAEQPELSAEFNAAMSQGTLDTAQRLPTAFDFSRYSTVADIGGGDGTLLSAILRAHPTLRGILFDSPEGLAQAGTQLAAEIAGGRCSLITGDFFATVPAGAEVYVLKSVIHDWSDARCAEILGHCRREIPDGGRLLIIEPVLPPVVDPATAGATYLTDLNMLVNVGGRERTRDDFEQLCRDTGFAIRDVTPFGAPNPFCLIEAEPV
ncbi:methyltransferase [Streptomyces triticagri]|uniref:Methyltransferase n=1 Tax=Streptomyces triticagri TaxID=2293568 RepID=A0A372M247_9ACTN|nr:methyltransferase [Streptomyces triticagri]RFU85014.1 methyltransferase [Streptomyces triticagri]